MAMTTDTAARPADDRIDARLLRRIARLTVPYWRRRRSWPAWIGLALLLMQGVALSYLAVRAAALLKQTTDTLLARDVAAFEAALAAYLLLYTVQHLLPQIRFVLDALVEADWRRWLTRHVVDQYLARRAYYDIGLRDDLDNPDQRIAECVRPFVDTTIQIVQWIVGVVARIAAAVAVFVSLDPRFLVVVPVLGAAQIAASFLIVPPTVRRQVAVQVAEGDLRRDLVHLRDHAEAIAFYGGEAVEARGLMARTREAAARQFRYDRFAALLGLTVHAGFAIAWMALPYLVLAEPVATGAMSYGTLVQATSITLMMRGVVQTLAVIVTSLGTLATQVARLAPLQERFDAMARERGEPGSPRIGLSRGGDRVAITGLSLATPDGARQLVRGLNLTVEAGTSLVIVGETGVGKSSLLRAMAGLWTRGAGRIAMPPAAATLFLPQSPYLTAGSLRAQLLYPRGAARDDAELRAILDAVRLPGLAAAHGGLDAVRDWPQILSGGERQRLAFARVLVARPAFVFLDEATSALDPETERHLYGLLAGTGASFVSVGHREAIIGHHDRVLTLRRAGGWALAPAGCGAPAPRLRAVAP